MQYVEIENFGPVEKVKINVNKFTILIGEQATGKSTVSRVIYFFKSLKEDLFTIVYNNFGEDHDLRQNFIKRIQSKFLQFFGSTKHLPFFIIKYFYTDDRYIVLKLNEAKFLNVEFSYKFYGAIGDEVFQLLRAIREPNKSRNTYEMIAYEQSKEKYVLRLKEIVDELFADSKNSLYVPAGRNITVSYPNQFKLSFFGDISIENEKSKNSRKYGQAIDLHLMIDYMTVVERNNEFFKNTDFRSLVRLEKSDTKDSKRKKALDKSLLLIENILKGRYKNDKHGEKIMFNRKGDRYVFLNHASSGQQEVIRILQDLFVILLTNDSVFRIIEEPEAHLYPLAQKNLVELMALVANETNSQFFITTHSPYVLSVTNNLIFSDIVSDLNVENLSNDYDLTKLDDKSYSAYGLKNSEGWEFTSIKDETTNLIGENYLDEVSEILGSEFDMMFQNYKKSLESNPKRIRKK